MTALDRFRGGLRARGLAIALPLQLAAMLLWPMAAAAIPPLPGGNPPPLPVPNPFVPAIGSPQGAPVAPCRFASLGPNEVRTLFRETGNSGTNFGIDPANPCHIFRTIDGNGVKRSDASGRGWAQSFSDFSQTQPIHNGQFAFGLVSTAGTGGGPSYIYDTSGSNGVVYTPDDGATWIQKINGLYSGGSGPTGGITAFVVAPSNPAVAYLAGNVAGQTIVYVTTSSGDQWQVAGQIQYPITSLSVDPGDPRHVVAAAGGPTTPVGHAGLDEYYDSPDGGAGWNTVAGPPNEPSPMAVTIGGGRRVYAITGSFGTNTTDITQVTGQKFWRLDPSRAWQQLTIPGSLGKDSVISYNPANPNEMIIASAAGPGIAMAGSLDGFSSTRYTKIIRTDASVASVVMRADRFGQFFALAKSSGEDQLLALRVTGLAPDPPPPGPVQSNFENALKVCNLHDLSKPGTLPGQRTTVYYKSGSIAFDGRYLDYANDDVGPEPGVIYRIDPATCEEQPPIRPSAAEFGGSKTLPLFSLTFDPRYVFNNGHTGAILARGGTGAGHDSRIPNEEDVAIYAIDPNPAPARMELAASQTCGHQFGPTECDQADPNLFNYDHYLDALWIPVPGDYDVVIKGLARLPARKGANRVVPIPTCMTTWRPPDPGNTDMAMWEPGADGILYVALENPDDTLVQRVNSRTCQYLDSFSHETYSEGPPAAGGPSNETDQMACDAITFGQGAPNVPAGTGTSALWIRDNRLNLVRAYPISHGFCPFPTTLQPLSWPATVRTGDTVTLCVVLQAATAGLPKPVSGQTVHFSLGGTGVGTGTTDSNGRACITTVVNGNGLINLVATYDGTEAYLPRQREKLGPGHCPTSAASTREARRLPAARPGPTPDHRDRPRAAGPGAPGADPGAGPVAGAEPAGVDDREAEAGPGQPGPYRRRQTDGRHRGQPLPLRAVRPGHWPGDVRPRAGVPLPAQPPPPPPGGAHRQPRPTLIRPGWGRPGPG